MVHWPSNPDPKWQPDGSLIFAGLTDMSNGNRTDPIHRSLPFLHAGVIYTYLPKRFILLPLGNEKEIPQILPQFQL